MRTQVLEKKKQQFLIVQSNNLLKFFKILNKKFKNSTRKYGVFYFSFLPLHSLEFEKHFSTYAYELEAYTRSTPLSALPMRVKTSFVCVNILALYLSHTSSPFFPALQGVQNSIIM